jgi:Patatin-like phospholipase
MTLRLPFVTKLAAAALALAALSACASVTRAPFTKEQQAVAVIPGIPNARVWSDDKVDSILARTQSTALARGSVVNVLALSGGGSNGAYGAGLLAGWSDRGGRPDFAVVTGASAGALIAPFAFLGPSYDTLLKSLFSEGIGEELLQIDGLQAIFGAGVFKTEPLKRLIARYVDDTMLERIGVEHRKGRRLLIVTTNLDAQRTAVWDMGAIAASGVPGALNLFRDVLVASASVPGVYSPVLINVEGEGNRFAEMHVDGGVRANLLVVPESLLLSSVPLASGLHPRVYIILNNKLEQEFEVVQGKALPIVSRAFTTAVKANTQNTLIATYDFARRNKWDFNLASIDGDYPTTTSLGFDRAYMQQLYDYGYHEGLQGAPWRKTLPATYQVPVVPAAKVAAPRTATR